MQGTIDRIWENTTRNHKRYHVLEIGGDNYSVWDAGFMEDLDEGCTVQYDWRQSGNYRNITAIKKIDTEPDTGSYDPHRKSLEIIRMSCLRSASSMLSGIDIEPEEKIQKALEIAREFEDYVTGKEEID